MKCGAEIITACPACQSPIPGDSTPAAMAELVATDAYERPAYCPSCGEPFPWTVTALTAGRELALEMEGLSEAERQTLAGTLDDLLTETPRTQVAAVRFKKLLAKAGRSAADGLRSIMVDVMSEAAKKAIFGQP
jgi:hypothetical protein